MLGALLKSRTGLAAIACIALVLIVTVTSAGFRLNTISPGFEGAKCTFFGAYFGAQSWSGLEGHDTLQKYQDAKSPILHETHGEGFGTVTQTVNWVSLATPNNPGLGYKWVKQPLVGAPEIVHKPDLMMQIESNIQLSEITRQGDPLGWNASDPLDARRVEYWSRTLLSTTNTSQSIQYKWQVTKESFILVPAEFWVGFYLVPSQTEPGTDSGWREGEWQNILTWFRLDFTTWDNAYKDAWENDPQINVYEAPHNGVVSGQQRTGDYRGGFPITGWICGWEKAGWTSTSGKEVTSPIWLTARGKDDKTYTPNELANLKDKLMAKVNFAPSMMGDFISLYDEPSATFSYDASMCESGDFSDPQAYTSYVKTPDSRMHKVMYFPINVVNFGTYTDGDWYNGYRVIYPSAYFRVRMIYGVYGTFTYLWTEEVTKKTDEGGLGYEEGLETHGTTIIYTPPSNTLASFWSQYWWLILIVVGGAILLIFAATIGLPLVTMLTLGHVRTRCYDTRALRNHRDAHVCGHG